MPEIKKIPFSLFVSFDSLLSKFTDFYNYHMDLLRDEFSPDGPFDKIEIELEKIGFPYLELLMKTDKRALLSYLRMYSDDFLNAIYPRLDVVERSKKFYIFSLSNVEFNDLGINLNGHGYIRN